MAICRTNAENIKIEPVYVTWEQQEVMTVTTVADVAGNKGGTGFKLPNSTGSQFYVWYDTGTDTDPAPAGFTGIEVTYTANATAATLASLTATAVNTNANFHAVVDPCDATKVIIQCKLAGAKVDGADLPGGDATGFTFLTTRQGSSLELGFIEGDIELGLTEDLLDVTSHQTGTQIIQALRTGRNIGNVTISMKESDAAKLKAIIEASGAEYTPSEGGSTAVSAWGSEDTKAFSNISSACKKLVMHPISKVSTDYSEDFCFWRAYPILTGLTLSGENARLVNVEFKIIPDQLLLEQVRQFVYGDHTQNFLKGA